MYRNLLALLIVVALPQFLRASSLNYNGNPVNNNQTLEECAGTNLSFAVILTPPHDTAIVFDASNNALDTLVAGSLNFSLNSPSNAGQSASYSIVYYQNGNPLSSLNFSISSYSNVSAGAVNPIGPSSISSERLCNGNSSATTLEVAVSGGDVNTNNFSYQWQSANNSNFNNPTPRGTSSTLNLSSLGSLGNDTYVRVIYTDNSCGSSDVSNSYFIDVWGPLQATSVSPVGVSTASSESICNNTSSATNLEVTVSGGDQNANNFSYQWQFDDNPSFLSPTNLGTNATFNLNTLGALISDTYIRVIYTDNSCGSSNTSNTYTVNVYSSFTVNNTIQASTGNTTETICYNNTINQNLSVQESGGAPSSNTYEWIMDDNLSFSSPTIIGTNSNILTPAQVGNLTSDTYIRVRVTDACAGPFNSTAYYVQVRDQFLVTDLSPVGSANTSEDVCYNNQISQDLQITETGGDPGANTYQWQIDDNPGFSSPSPIGTNSPSISKAAVGNLFTDSYIRCRVTDACGGTINSPTYNINVWGEVLAGAVTPSGGSTATSENICDNSGSSNSLEVAVSGGDQNASNFSYLWQSDDNPGFSSPQNIGTLANVNLSILGNRNDDTYVRVIYTDNSCGQSDTSNTYTLNVWDPFVVGDVQGAGSSTTETICYNTQIGQSLSVVESGGNPSANSYQWEIATNPSFSGASPIGTNSSSISPAQVGNRTADSYIRCKVTDACGGQLTSNTYTVQVRSPFLVTNLSQISGGNTSEDVCYSEQISGGLQITESGGDPAANTYQWQIDDNPGFSSPSPIGTNSPSITKAAVNDLFTDSYIRCRVTDACGGTVNSPTYSINVWGEVLAGAVTPSGGSTATSENICDGSSSSNSLEVAISGGDQNASNFSYQWQSDDNPGFSSPQNIGTLANVNLSILGNRNDDTYVRVIYTDNSCGQSDTSDTYTINVWDPFVVGDVQGAGSSTTETICYGTQISQSLSVVESGGNPSANSYQWEVATNPSFSSPSPIGTNSSSISPAQVGNRTADSYIRCKVTDACGGQLTSNTYTVQVRNPFLVTNLSQISGGNTSEDVCYGEQVAVGLQITESGGDPTANTYQWEIDDNPGFSTPSPIGTNSPSITKAAVSDLFTDSYIRCRVTDACGGTVNSPTYFVNVWDSLQANAVDPLGSSNADREQICYKTTSTTILEVDTAGGDRNANNFAYQWQSADNPAFTNFNNEGTASTLDLSTLGDLRTDTYLRVIFTDNACNQDDDTSDTYLVRVWDELEANSLLNNSSSNQDIICFGNSSMDIITVDTAGGDRNANNFQYAWIADSTSPYDFVDAFGISGNSISLNLNSLGNLTTTHHVRARFIDQACGNDDDTSDSFIITVEPELLAGDISFKYDGNDYQNSLDLCFGDPLKINHQNFGGGANTGYTFTVLQDIYDEGSGNYVQNKNYQLSSVDQFDLSDSLDTPGRYRFEVTLSNSCGTELTNQIELWYTQPPYFDLYSNPQAPIDLEFEALDPELTGSLDLCEDQQNVLVRLNRPQLSDYSYDWSNSQPAVQNVAGSGSILQMWSPNGVNSSLDLAINWDQLRTDPNISACDRQVLYANTLGVGSPDPNPIVEIRGILIVDTEFPEGEYFRWGRIEKRTWNWEYLSEWSDQEYIDMSSHGGVDTSTYVYVCANSNSANGDCRSYSYYPETFSLDPISTNPIGLDPEISVAPITPYPNPSDGLLFYKLPQGERIEQIKISDLSGKSLPFQHSAENGRLEIKELNHKQLLLVIIQTNKQVQTFKVLVD